jgi:hypothetical protein
MNYITILGEADPIVRPNIRNYVDVVRQLGDAQKALFEKTIRAAESNNAVKFNQYNKPSTDADWTRYLVILILHGSKERYSSEFSSRPYNAEPLFICWESTRGDLTPGGYYRISFQGQKVQNYGAIATAFYGQQPGKDVSHMCGNPLCVRPSHLVWESHSQNMSRIGCPGVIYHVYNDRFFDEACSHTPRCKKVTVMRSYGKSYDDVESKDT